MFVDICVLLELTGVDPVDDCELSFQIKLSLRFVILNHQNSVKYCQIIHFHSQEASFARDATIKAIYESLFDSIVRAVNVSLLTGGTQPVVSAVAKPAKPTKTPPGGYFVCWFDFGKFQPLIRKSQLSFKKLF